MPTTQLPDSVIRVLRERRAHLVGERSKATAEFDREIADIDAVLPGALDTAPAVVELATQFSSKIIAATTDALIAAGRVATTAEVHASLAGAGVVMPPDAHRLITKALTRTGRYNGHRTNGWTHKAAPVLNGPAGESN